jgi:hypothetical protein
METKPGLKVIKADWLTAFSYWTQAKAESVWTKEMESSACYFKLSLTKCQDKGRER